MSVSNLRLILASGSPRRRDLLTKAGYAFEVAPANIDESNFPANLLPADVAKHLAQKKAEAASALRPDSVVLAADTVVSFGDQMLGKPRDANDARAMLTLLAGTTHLCITGVAVQHRETNFLQVIRVMSAVRMRFLTNDELERYIAGGEWADKAGGYGIQDQDPFVTRISGSETNIVGLPMDETRKLLADAGIQPQPVNS